MIDQWYFACDPCRAALIAEARTWLGTPFRAHHAIKGVGVDCAHFVAEVYFTIGVLPRFEFPSYALDEGSHSHDHTGKAIEAIRATKRFREIMLAARPASFMVGDIVCFHLGRIEHHLGLMISGRKFQHAIARRGVIESCIEDPTYKRRVTRLFRMVRISDPSLKGEDKSEEES